MKLSEAGRGRLKLALELWEAELPELDKEDFEFMVKLFGRMETVVRAEMQAREERREKCLGSG